MRETVSFFNNQALVLAFLALVLNLLFLFFNYHNDYYLGLLTPHGEIAYNVYRYNSVKGNPYRSGSVGQKQRELGRMVDYAEIDHEKFGPPMHYRSIQDTVGYGVVLGLLWKITRSLRYVDMQLLQILLFSLFMFFLYSLSFMLFQSTFIALLCGLSQLFFLPLFYLNVQVMRDIWAYYGVILLLWLVVGFLQSFVALRGLLFGSFCFALIQFVRPTIAASLVGVSGILFLYAFFDQSQLKKIIGLLGGLWFMNILGFWLPFMVHNKIAYNRYFVMASGQGLLQGLGEYPNKWGAKLGDGWVGKHITEKYGLIYGTPEFDDKAKEEFVRFYKQDPWHFWKSVLQRIPLIFLPGLPWNNISNVVDYRIYSSLWDKVYTKLAKSFDSFTSFFDFLTRQIFIRIFLLGGYLGMLLMLFNRKYLWLMLILAAGIIPSYSIIQSHVEYRYVTPFYGVFALCVGYFLSEVLKKYKESNNEKNSAV